MIAVRDIGRYGLWAFEKHAELNGREIDLAGDQLTMPQTADLIGQAMGRKVSFFQVPIADVRKASEDYAAMLEWFDRVGYDADIEKTAKESGVQPTRFTDWVKTANWQPLAATR
jgi:hypothetical protein